MDVAGSRPARRDVRIARTWGRLAPVVQFVSNEQQQTADGEGCLAAHLVRELAGEATLLHSRQVPGTRGDIDHLVIAPSGVWVVDAKNYSGKVERRDVGKWRAGDHRLFIDGRDRTKLVDGIKRQSSGRCSRPVTT